MRQSDRVWVKDWEETGEQVGGEDKVCQESMSRSRQQNED